jgi:spermidine/putrescine transport system substrate-binding protein
MAGCSGFLSGGSDNSLKLLDYSYAVDNNDILQRFSDEHGVETTYQDSQSSQQNLAKLRSDRVDADLIAFANYAVPPAIEEGLLEPIDVDRISNYDGVFDFLKKDYFESGEQLYAVPRSFGTAPLVVDTSRITDDVTSLEALWDTRYDGMIGGRDDARYQLSFANMARGRDPNPQSLDELDEAAVKQDFVDRLELSSSLWSTGGDAESLMRNGEVAVQEMYNFNALSLTESDSQFEQLFPTEGARAWFLTYTIPAGADNVDMAHTFIEDWHAELGYDGLMAPNQIALPNERVFEERDVSKERFGLDDPDQFVYGEPKPQELISRITELWTEAKSEVSL